MPSARIHPSISNKMSERKIEDIRMKLQMPGTGKTEDELMSVARDFESILLYKMVESMRSTVPKSGLFDSFSMETFQSMMDQEIANEMAKKKGVGLADMVYRQLSRLQDIQEKRNAVSPNAGREQKLPINVGTHGENK
ncbi:MAG: rod-binding protein [Nitrospinales bacterium]